MSITFNDSREMSEYLEQKFEEGYECEARKIGEKKWKVSIVGKRERTSQRLMATEKFEKAFAGSYTGDLEKSYEQLGGLSNKSMRTAQEVKAIAKDELHKAGIYNVEVHVTPRFSSIGESDAAVLHTEEPDDEGGAWLVFLHPIHEYTDEDYLREIVKHEIKHIKKEI